LGKFSLIPLINWGSEAQEIALNISDLIPALSGAVFIQREGQVVADTVEKLPIRKST
jgi:hypothetical protein